ncbi:MAG: DUF4038 domain-containing protein, partial [bacterium]|nr:DUF4038 domain-containing protein [bacterium]MDW8164417.1 DUF4038 domain-containing protein [Candidatus Omnitrophota bacterium]
MEITIMNVLELIFESRYNYANPIWDVNVKVNFLSPSGKKHIVEGFWDGGKIWKVRFSPDELGVWKWELENSNFTNEKSGSFICTEYKGTNPLYLHGPVKLSQNRKFFTHSDGTPFFYLADTAWNGVLKAKLNDWKYYLQTRKEQGFTAIQFVSTNWRAFLEDEYGETAYTGKEQIQINPEFFKRLDPKVEMINMYGLVAVPVILWALGLPSPGVIFSEDNLIKLARYIVARWGAYQVIWILGGDGDYKGEKAEKWKRIGRNVFRERHDRLITMHPCGLSWIVDEFRDEDWFDFIGYQSGHGDSIDDINWLVFGPPSQEWLKEPKRPIVNLEPNYEFHLAYQSKKPFTDFHVRRALYWSLLLSPTCGVTYGNHGIWFWAEKEEIPLDHPNSGIAPIWNKAIVSQGAKGVIHLKKFFSSIEWWKLQPSQEILINQPGTTEKPYKKIVVSMSEDKDLAVLYTPEGANISLKTELIKRPAIIKWFNPRTGEFLNGEEITAPQISLKTPDSNDW